MKFAVKLLSPTDLTLFEPMYRVRTVAAQKGINLNVDVITSIYPRLPPYAPGTGLPVTLEVYGPQGAKSQRVETKFTRAPPRSGTKGTKNWRLSGGVLIPEPLGEAGRYSAFSEGDIAVFGFSGDPLPDAVRLVLFARDTGAPDATLVDRFTKRLGLRPRVRSMVEVSPQDLDDLTRDLPSGHPVRLLLKSRDEELLEAAAGDEDAAESLYSAAKSSKGRSVSWEDMAEADARNRLIGRRGEEVIDHMLSKDQAAGRTSSYVWEAKDKATSPFDFSVVNSSGEPCLIDVKTTSGEFGNRFFLSTFEAQHAASARVPYYIYRVYELDNPTGPSLQRSDDIRGIARSLLDAVRKLPKGFGVGTITVEVDALKWSAPETLELPPKPVASAA